MSEQTEAQDQDNSQGKKRLSRDQLMKRRRFQMKQQRLRAEKSQFLEQVDQAKQAAAQDAEKQPVEEKIAEQATEEVKNTPEVRRTPEPRNAPEGRRTPEARNAHEGRRNPESRNNSENRRNPEVRNNSEVRNTPEPKNTTEAKPASDNRYPAQRNNDQRRNQPRRPAPQQRNTNNTANEKISIVVPLYNEEESLRPLAEAIKKAMGQYNNNYEVIFVDDGSTDRSAIVLRELCRDERRFKYLSFQKNNGKSAALHVGFQAATGVFVVTMDADLQDDPAEIPNLIRRLREGYDMVSGWKKVRYDPFIKKYSSRFFNKVTGLMSGINIHDFNCGLKAYKHDVVKSVSVYGEMHRYIPVLAKWQGFTVTEVAVKHHARKFGKTKFGISRFFKGFVDLLTVMFVTRFIRRPMHLFGLLGALSFILGFIVNGYLSVEWFLGKPLSNRPMLFLGMLLIIVGVQFFSIGLLGEMMVYNQQEKKEYRIKDKQLKN